MWVENQPMNSLSGEKELSQFFVVQLMETNLQTRFGISPTTAFFLIYSIEIIAQSSKVAGKIQRKGKMTLLVFPPPPNSNIFASAIFVLLQVQLHAAFNAENNPAVARHQPQEKKYPL